MTRPYLFRYLSTLFLLDIFFFIEFDRLCQSRHLYYDFLCRHSKESKVLTRQSLQKFNLKH